MADVAVRAQATAAAPRDYKIPGAQELIPRQVFAHMDGTSATSQWFPCLQLLDPAGNEMGSWIDRSNPMAAGASADVTWFPRITPPAGQVGSGTLIESFFVDTRNAAGATSATVLTSGTTYLVTATGTWSYTTHGLDVGTPDANALYPTPGRIGSNQVGFDPEAIFAYYSGGSVPGGGIGHHTLWQYNLGSGFAYVTPTDGTHATPVASRSYTYSVTGQGSPLSAMFVDNPGQYGDNYGYVLVTIRGQGSTGLPGVGANHAILRSNGTASVWEARPDIVEADLSLSDVTTANSSTSAHGLLRKLDNNAAHFLDGTGAWSSVPSGVTSLDSITGAITLAAGSGIAITDNSPSAGNIKITASGSGIVTELDYVQITSSVNVTHTTDATADTIITGNAVSYSGSQRIKIEFWSQDVTVPSGNAVTVVLYDGSTDLGRFGTTANHTGSSNDQVFYSASFLTPSAGSHTFSIRAWIFSAGTGVIGAGAGGAGVNLPAWYRITTA